MRYHVNNFSPKILVTGGEGQLATALRNHSEATKHKLIFCSKGQLDITYESSIRDAITTYQPDIIINTAAYTAVDQAEQNRELALLINHTGAKNLAIIAEHFQIPLIHFSTDYIFDGLQTHAYQETDVIHPINTYGLSKWLGEEAVRQYNKQHIILRVSGLFSEYGNNFLKTILRLANEKRELRIVHDQITCPTHANDIATLLFSLFKNLSHWGTYHFCNLHPISWYDFAVTILNEAKKNRPIMLETIHAIRSAEYKTLAKRPAYSVLNCDKIYRDFGVRPSSWKTHLAQSIRMIMESQ